MAVYLATSAGGARSGTAGSDVFIGLAGNDTFTGAGGDDAIYGGGGFDTAVYGGSIQNYSIAKKDFWSFKYYTVTDRNVRDGDMGTDALYDVELLKFDDYSLYLDGRNNAVYTVSDSAAAGANTPLNLSAASLLANDIDFDGDALSIAGVQNALHGTVTMSADHSSIVFTPTAGFVGTASFQYVASDGRGGNSIGTVNIQVTDRAAPTFTSPSAFSYAENQAAGAVIATVSATDNVAVVGYAITGGNDQGYFAITASGAISLTAAGAAAAVNDYETLANAASLSVAAYDSAGNTKTQVITLTETDVDEGTGGSGGASTIYLADIADATDKSDGFKIGGLISAQVAELGYSVSSAGDVNGDGVDDIIVGARSASVAGAAGAGAAYVIYGQAGMNQGTIEAGMPGFLTPSVGFQILGEVSGDEAGFRVSSAGDVNGDGYDDILVGALANDAGGSNAGAAYVIYGKAGTSQSTINLNAIADASDTTDGFKIVGETSFDVAGSSVSSAGDVNGDGIDDILIGAYGNDAGGAQAGAAYVVYGKAGTSQGTINLNAIADASDTSDGFKIIGETADDSAGYSVSAAGDVNGDGIDDILIGAYGNEAGGPNAGAAYVIYGTAGTSQGTINLDAIADASDTTDGFKIIGESEADLASFSVSSAGDVNGDGIDDILVGARYNDAGGPDAGAAYVIYGEAGVSQGTINLDAIADASDTTDGFKIVGASAYAAAGISVSSAGDVNGDGIDDILVGATGTGAGSAYVIFGWAGTSRGTIDLDAIADASDTTDGFEIVGENLGGRAGFSVSSAGDVNADGIDDLLVGAPSNDAGGYGAGAAYIIYGSADWLVA